MVDNSEWAAAGEELAKAMQTAASEDGVKLAMLAILVVAFGNLPPDEFMNGARLLAGVHDAYERRQAEVVAEAVEETRADCLRRWPTTVQ